LETSGLRARHGICREAGSRYIRRISRKGAKTPRKDKKKRKARGPTNLVHFIEVPEAARRFIPLRLCDFA
jgi:hypothetical protein